MPSLTSTVRTARACLPQPSTIRALSTTPSHPEAHILASLSDVPSSYNKRIRRGRGPASGKGKTSGRGHKGQKQHGKVPRGFQGGQTPNEVVHGKRGAVNVYASPPSPQCLSLPANPPLTPPPSHADPLTPVNLSTIASWVSTGRLNPTLPITIRELRASRVTSTIRPGGVKLLAKDAAALQTPLHIIVSRASAAAIAAVEAAGGSVTTRYYSPAAIRRVLRGESHPVLSRLARPEGIGATVDAAGAVVEGAQGQRRAVMPGLVLAQRVMKPEDEYRYRLPDATSRRDLEYYRDPAKRGYLSWQVGEGEGPSLFFKTPVEAAAGVQEAKRRKGGEQVGKRPEGLGRLW